MKSHDIVDHGGEQKCSWSTSDGRLKQQENKMANEGRSVTSTRAASENSVTKEDPRLKGKEVTIYYWKEN